MYCKNCGELLFEGQTICIKCGNPIEEQKGNNKNNNSASKQPFKIKNKGDFNGHSKVIIVLLCLFLGSFGAHNFIMGENKKGIVKIILTVFCGLGFILSIIDLVKITTNNYTYNQDAFI